MRTLTFGFNCSGEVYRASVALPDEFFTEQGLPKWHILNSRFSSPNIVWDRIIGGVQKDEPVVNQPQQPPSMGEELQKLRDAVRALEEKLR
jgi:hypothetical protein